MSFNNTNTNSNSNDNIFGYLGSGAGGLGVSLIVFLIYVIYKKCNNENKEKIEFHEKDLDKEIALENLIEYLDQEKRIHKITLGDLKRQITNELKKS